jgi:hypothetical protein
MIDAIDLVGRLFLAEWDGTATQFVKLGGRSGRGNLIVPGIASSLCSSPDNLFFAFALVNLPTLYTNQFFLHRKTLKGGETFNMCAHLECNLISLWKQIGKKC